MEESKRRRYEYVAYLYFYVAVSCDSLKWNVYGLAEIIIIIRCGNSHLMVAEKGFSVDFHQKWVSEIVDKRSHKFGQNNRSKALQGQRADSKKNKNSHATDNVMSVEAIFFGEKNEEHLMRIIFHYEYVEDIVNWPVNPCPMMWTNSQTMADASTPFAASLTLFCCCCCLLSHSTYTSTSDRKSTQNCVLIALCSSSTICKQNARMYVIFAQLYTVLLLSVFVFYRHIQNECAQAAACRGC